MKFGRKDERKKNESGQRSAWALLEETFWEIGLILTTSFKKNAWQSDENLKNCVLY